MWQWLKRPWNQKPLMIVGSGLAALATAAWATFGHFYPSQSAARLAPKFDVQAECGIAAGDDVSSGNITIACGPAPEEIEALIEATVSKFDLPSLVAAAKDTSTPTPPEFSELGAALGLTEVALKEVLSELGSSSAADDPAAFARIVLSNANIVPGSEDELHDESLVRRYAQEEILLPQKATESEIEPNNDIFEANQIVPGKFYKSESSNNDPDWFVFKNDELDGVNIRIRNCGQGYPEYSFYVEIYAENEKAIDSTSTSARHDVIAFKKLKNEIFFIRLISQRKKSCNYEFRVN